MKRRLRIFHTAGPGDVIGTYEHWKAGREDPRELSMTYSGQFYTLCRELRASALVIAQRPGGRHVQDGSFTIRESVPLFGESPIAFLYHLGQTMSAIRLTWQAWHFGADIAVVSSGTHWFMLVLLKLLGIRVVPDLHCTLWPTGHPSAKITRRLVTRLNGWFWRMVPSATLCISPECERQVMHISARHARNLLPTRPTYRRDLMGHMPAPNREVRPFVLFYAGRLERDKGVFDLLSVMQKLHSTHPGLFRCVFSGTGSAHQDLAQLARASGLAQVIHFTGQLQQDELRGEMAAAHVVVVPTTVLFAEGLNRVAVESILAGRPVIVTSICPASELIADAAIVVGPGDIAAMCDAVQRLVADRALYERLRNACPPLAANFYDLNRSWGAQLEKAIRLALPQYFVQTEGIRRLA